MKKITVKSEIVKWFALLTMTMDHIDKVFAGTTWISDTFGRTAFPIFSYLIISNFCTYHNAKKYILRLGIFGLLAQVIAYHYDEYNVLFSFLYAIVFLSATERLCRATKLFFVQAYFCILLFTALFPFIYMADYGMAGFCYLLALYAYIKDKTKFNCFAVILASIVLNRASLVAAASTVITTLLLLFVIEIKNSKRLVKWWFFYVYYPLHRLLLHLLKLFLIGI